LRETIKLTQLGSAWNFSANWSRLQYRLNRSRRFKWNFSVDPGRNRLARDRMFSPFDAVLLLSTRFVPERDLQLSYESWQWLEAKRHQGWISANGEQRRPEMKVSIKTRRLGTVLLAALETNKTSRGIKGQKGFERHSTTPGERQTLQRMLNFN
jgi:hypothetical protein